MAVTATTPTANRHHRLRAGDTRANPAAMASTASSQEARTTTFSSVKPAPTNDPDGFDRLHRAPNEDVVERLDGGEQRGEHGEVEREPPSGRGVVRVAPRPSQLAGDRRGEQREQRCDDEQLAQPGADYGEERQAEQVVAEVAAELGDLAPDRTAVEEQQPLLPRGGRRTPMRHASSHDGISSH